MGIAFSDFLQNNEVQNLQAQQLGEQSLNALSFRMFQYACSRGRLHACSLRQLLGQLFQWHRRNKGYLNHCFVDLCGKHSPVPDGRQHLSTSRHPTDDSILQNLRIPGPQNLVLPSSIVSHHEPTHDAQMPSSAPFVSSFLEIIQTKILLPPRPTKRTDC